MKLSLKPWVLAAIFTLLCVFPQTLWAAPALKLGDKGWKVKTVQQKLRVVGVQTAVTGKYSAELVQAVKTFQQREKLQPTGQVDDATYDRLVQAAFAKEGIRGVDVKALLQTAAKFKGVPYKFGGVSPKGFDCSGYTGYVFQQHRAILPRAADTQCGQGIFVLQKNLKPGDLVFFSTYEKGASHVGIYAGEGKFWHVSTKKGVMLSGLKDEYWKTRYYGARRVLVNN